MNKKEKVNEDVPEPYDNDDDSLSQINDVSGSVRFST